MKFNNKNVTIHDGVVVGRNVKIGDNTTVYSNVVIGDNAIIADNCVIGEPINEYYFNETYINPATRIGENSLVRSFSIIYAGSEMGSNFQTGHHVSIREYTRIGNNVSIGTKSDIQGFCTIGNYCRFHSYVNIGQQSIIDDFVFIYPFAILTNDPLPPSEALRGVRIGKYSQIASHAVLIGGVKVGDNCLIGANATVNKDVPSDSLVISDCMKIIPNLSRLPFFTQEGSRKYPWPNNFDRGMPWKDVGFDNWKNLYE